MLLVDAMARALGLPQAGSGEVAYGVVDGFLVQVQLAERNGLTRIEVIVRYAGEGKEEELRRALDDSPDVKASGIRFRHVQIDDTTATLGIFHEQLSFPEESVVLRRARAFLEVVKSVSAPEPATCRCCGSPSPEDPVLFGGVVDRVCPACPASSPINPTRTRARPVRRSTGVGSSPSLRTCCSRRRSLPSSRSAGD